MTPPERSSTNKELVLALLEGAFVDRDSTVFDRLLGPTYTQHNPRIPDGIAGIKAAAAGLPANLGYEPGMVTAEGDYVMVHGRYTGWGPKPLVAVDIFRVADGKVVEHWDVMQEEVPAQGTASGNAMFTNPQAQPILTGETMGLDIDGTRRALVGEWVSIAPELRPSSLKSTDGSLKPFYLRRDFKYFDGDRFELTIVNSADPLGKAPLARIFIRGHMRWRGAHPIATGAQKVDFVADEAYDVTPLHPGFADLLDKVAGSGYRKWEVDGTQSIFGKSFAPFGLVEGQDFMEHDLVYLHRDHLYWGARNVDGRGFDTEENRPTNLQIPLERK